MLIRVVFVLGLVPSAAFADAGLEAVVGRYSPQRPNWHQYQADTVVLCREDERCTAELVKKAFQRNVMPCQDPNTPVRNGVRLEPRDPVTGCFYSPGHVWIGLHDDGFSVTIRTDPDHRLYDGVVIRRIQRQGGNFVITTEGVGNNKSYLWARINEAIGKRIFRSQNVRMKAFVDGCLAGKRCE